MLRFCIYGKTFKPYKKLPCFSPGGKLSKSQISCKSEILSKLPRGYQFLHHLFSGFRIKGRTTLVAFAAIKKT